MRIARVIFPDAVRVLGGGYATFMHKQGLSAAPWGNVIVRGEGEDICTEFMLATEDGRFPFERHQFKRLAFQGGDQIVAAPAASTANDPSKIKPDWSVLEWSKCIYIPLGTRVAILNFSR